MAHTLTSIPTILVAASLTLIDCLAVRSCQRPMRGIFAAAAEAGLALTSILTISLFFPM